MTPNVETRLCGCCQRSTRVNALVARVRAWEDGGQSGTEEIEVCASCADAIDRKVA